MELSQHIRAARGHLTIEEFASLAGCSWKTLWRWETGRGTPGSSLHRRRLVELGVPAEAIEHERGVA